MQIVVFQKWLPSVKNISHDSPGPVPSMVSYSIDLSGLFLRNHSYRENLGASRLILIIVK